MKKIHIITDSACDFTQEQAKEMGITILPLKTMFTDGEYLDGITLSHEEFYEKLIETREFPKTSQVNAFQYEEAYKEHQDEDILVITISKKISGCYQSAKIASEEFKNVHLVDSCNVSLGEQMLIKWALKLINDGKNIDEVVDELNKIKKDLCVIALIDTLEFLKKGGRLSAASAFVGTLLSFKPVIEVKNGKLEMAGKARGSKNGQNLLREKIHETGGIDYSMPLCVAYTGLSDAILKKYLKDSEDLYIDNIKTEDIPVTTIGSTIGSHVGPNAIGVAFFKKVKSN